MASRDSYKRITLENGVRLILVPMPGVESIATSVMVGVGSRFETEKNNGISHFLEHMVFKGTEKFPTTDDVNVIERIGGLQNAYTDIDITNYHNKVMSDDWKLALEINTQLALHPRLEETYADKERNVIIEEMKRYEDEPASKAEETAHMMMYPGTRLGMRIIGYAETLMNVHAKELSEYHSAWYVPARTVVVLAGKINGQSESEIVSQVRSWYSAESRRGNGDMEPVADSQSEPKLATVTKPDASQAHFFLGLRTFPRGSGERFAWHVFNLLMGVSFTSRLFREIREKRGLCYHIRSNSNNWADVGNWQVYAGVATDKVYEAVKATLAELAKARDKGIDDEEVEVAKKRLRTMIAFKSEDPEFQNEFYGRQEVFNQPIMTLDEHLEQIEKVTAAEINALLKKYFVTKNLNLAVVWNKKEDQSLRTLLSL
jgi:predicted Zn-dependent peptidase